MSQELLAIPNDAELRDLPEDGGEHWNRLVFEHSPYLLQHAANPVDWYPWGEEAFTKAKQQNKPIFLSIGYATCHWCHVMERESFEDDEVAALINQDFIAIKVDREERPDIDQLYMAACQLISGSGGWPLSCFLSPQAEVFLAATYFPKHSQHGRPGMMDLLPNVAAAWKNKKDDLIKTADEITKHLQARNQPVTGEHLSDKIADKATELLADSFDKKYGGFGNAPKFPSPHQHLFLLRQWYKNRNQATLDMVVQSLTAMRLGGLFDHVGFGFHRYSTDSQWLLPHFEKMLYDQAMLLLAYSETYAATKNDFFKQTAEEIIDYLQSRMQSEEGGFYSAEDADSEGEEGKFYIWTISELNNVLEPAEVEWFQINFNIHAAGNFNDELSGQTNGTNIPHLNKSPQTLAIETEQSLEQWQQQWQIIRKKLFLHREQRIHPLLDDKILTDWNGLMIAALARASRLLDNDVCLKMAKQAFSFVENKLVNKHRQLLKRYRNGHSGLQAHLDDYAFMAWAAFELHQTSLDPEYLIQGLKWMEMALEKFWDSGNGGFYFTESNTKLSVRAKEVYDGAMPSGNSVMAQNLAFLYQLSGRSRWKHYFDELTKSFAAQINHYPPGHAFSLSARDSIESPEWNLLITGTEIPADTLAPLKGHYQPNTIFLAVDESHREVLAQIAPFTRDYPAGKLTLYLCKAFSCELPVSGRNKIQQRLEVMLNDSVVKA